MQERPYENRNPAGARRYAPAPRQACGWRRLAYLHGLMIVDGSREAASVERAPLPNGALERAQASDDRPDTPPTGRVARLSPGVNPLLRKPAYGNGFGVDTSPDSLSAEEGGLPGGDGCLGYAAPNIIPELAMRRCLDLWRARPS